MTTFKEIAHFHMGCRIDSGKNTVLTPRILERYFDDEWDVMPILIPMDKMNRPDAEELCNIKQPALAIKQMQKMPNGLACNVGSDEYFQGFECLNAAQFQFLLSKHYNVFNLPENEFIDATTLTPNPYNQK